MPEASHPRVLIADDHTMVAEALTKLLEKDFVVVATVFDGRALVQTAEQLRPDAALVDVGLPLLNGLEAADRLKRSVPQTKVIYLTVNDDPDIVAEALRRGAAGYLLKNAAASELVDAIKCALAGGCIVSQALQRSRLDDGASDRTVSRLLTERQVEVLQLLAEGYSMKEVAAVLNVTTRTVAFHKYRIMTTLNLGTDAELVQYALRKHVVFS